MNPSAGGRWRSVGLVGASNVLSLAASLVGLVLAARMIGQDRFSAYAAALAIQALCATAAAAVGPVCGRILSSDRPDAGACRRFRFGAGSVSAALVLAAGAASELSGAWELGAVVWLCLSLQLPLGALEAHRLQVFQMEGDFGRWSLWQPLSRLARAVALLAGWSWGLEGVLWTVLLQTVGQILTGLALSMAGGRDAPAGEGRFEWGAAGWNTLSGAVVWGSTRANLLVASTRLEAGQSGLYGLAETLSNSLLVLNQSIMTLLQPAIYRWKASRGVRTLVGSALVAGGAGTAAAGAAALVFPWVAGLVLDPSWRGLEIPFAVFCAGSVCQAWASVAAAVLHRLRAGGSILVLESAGGIAMLAAMFWLSTGAPAWQAAACWALGRLVWMAGGMAVAALGVRRALRQEAAQSDGN